MSGIYIQGMKMPDGGYRTVEIAYAADGYPMAIADGGDVCSVIPVGDHGKLIDEDELKKEAAKVLSEINQYINILREERKPEELAIHLTVYGLLQNYIMRLRTLPTIIPADKEDKA